MTISPFKTLALFALLVSLVFVSGCGKMKADPQAQMEKVMVTLVEFFAEFGDDLDNYDSKSGKEKIKIDDSFNKKFRGINVKSCPEDFQNAFNEYRESFIEKRLKGADKELYGSTELFKVLIQVCDKYEVKEWKPKMHALIHRH